MHFAKWVESEPGRLAQLATKFGVTKSAVSQWKTNGVPLRLMKAVRDQSAGVVTLDDMVPGRGARRRAG